MRACDRRAESRETGTSQEGPVRLAVRRNPCSRAGAVSGARLKARRRGGLVLLTMSTPAPALVITTPTEVGGALSMVTEVARDRGVVSVERRRERALYPKLHPGPHPLAPESVASNQRARLYGAMIELVAARGYESSTVAELCALAGGLQADAVRAVPGRQAAVLPGDLRHCRTPRRDAHPQCGAVRTGRDRGGRPAGAAVRAGGGVRARGGGIPQRRAARAVEVSGASGHPGTVLPEIETVSCARARAGLASSTMEPSSCMRARLGGNPPAQPTSPQDPCRSGSYDEDSKRRSSNPKPRAKLSAVIPVRTNARWSSRKPT